MVRCGKCRGCLNDEENLDCNNCENCKRRKSKKGKKGQKSCIYRKCCPSLTPDMPSKSPASLAGGRDSGVGSHDGGGERREWGRLGAIRKERRLVRRAKAAARELATTCGGELVLVYRPRQHPNLPGLGSQEAKLVVPARSWFKPVPGGSETLADGFFLKRLGVTESDVLNGRLPDIASRGLAVVSNGLAIDLTRLGKRRSHLAGNVVTFIFSFLELNFPDELVQAAMTGVWDCLQENLEYLESCCDLEEMLNFVHSPFTLPEEVVEMANVNLENDAEEDLDDDIEDESASVGEADINSMDTEGGMLIFPNDLQGVELDSPTKAVITQVMNEGHLPDVLTGLQSEDENYSYTAHVLDMPPVDSQQDYGNMYQDYQPPDTATTTYLVADGTLCQQQAQATDMPIAGHSGQKMVTIKAVHRSFEGEIEDSGGGAINDISMSTLNDIIMEVNVGDGREEESPKKRSRTREVTMPSRFRE